jgi:Domain of unknown function (DUF697)
LFVGGVIASDWPVTSEMTFMSGSNWDYWWPDGTKSSSSEDWFARATQAQYRFHADQSLGQGWVGPWLRSIGDHEGDSLIRYCRSVNDLVLALREKTRTQRERKTNLLIAGSVTAAATVGFFDPTGVFDLAAVATSSVTMLGGMAAIYEVPFDRNFYANLLTQSIGWPGLFLTAMKISSWALKQTFIGWVGGAFLNALANGFIVWRVGSVFHKKWARGSEPPTLLDIGLALRSWAGFAEDIKGVLDLIRGSSSVALSA